MKIATLYAGADRGSVWLPEVDDEVLLAFEHGDVNYPYVIGALWNTQAKPPETNANGRNDVKLICSRSGHAARLRESVEVTVTGGSNGHAGWCRRVEAPQSRTWPRAHVGGPTRARKHDAGSVAAV